MVPRDLAGIFLVTCCLHEFPATVLGIDATALMASMRPAIFLQFKYQYKFPTRVIFAS